MSFKTMDGVEVYDKRDVDNLVEPIQQNATEAKQEATSLATRKLDKSEANLEFAADRQRLDTLETGKADKSELSSEVTRQVDSIITTKLQAIESDINHIVDTEIAHELQDYDDAHTADAKVDQKIATATDGMATQTYVDQAIAAIPNPGVASAADVESIVNQHF